MIRSGNELWMYYSGSPLKHNEAELDALVKPENRRLFSRVICTVGRFVSADAGEVEGSFITPPLKFKGAKLNLNVKTGPAGEVRAGLQDASGRQIPEYGLQDCVPITGDATAKTVTWTGGADLSAYNDIPVRLVVKMKNARLYAFQFVP
jgi:hypothetical protein